MDSMKNGYGSCFVAEYDLLGRLYCTEEGVGCEGASAFGFGQHSLLTA